MPFLMKALKTFMHVRMGQEFDAETQARATELENKGLAEPVTKSSKSSRRRTAQPNVAAETGPLPGRGGQTGAGKGVSLSRRGQARRAKKKASRGSAKKGGAGK